MKINLPYSFRKGIHVKVCQLNQMRLPVITAFYLFFQLFHVPLFPQNLKMLYNEVTVCQGDSFNLELFLTNQVEVPVEINLLGWENLKNPVVSPGKDTVFRFSYVYKSAPDRILYENFTLHIRSRPYLSADSLSFDICSGTPLKEPDFIVKNSDKVYWQNMQTKEKFPIGENLEYAEDEDSVVYALYASNDHCPESVQKEFVWCIYHPGDFGLMVSSLKKDPVSCLDSVSLNRSPDDFYAQVYYQNEIVNTFPLIAVPSEYLPYTHSLSWQKEDAYTNGDSLLFGIPYENILRQKMSVTEPICHSTVEFMENKQIRIVCDSVLEPRYSISYVCASNTGNGKIYFGSKDSLLNVEFDNLPFPQKYWPVFESSMQYDINTYSFHYKGCAEFCWTESVSSDFSCDVTLVCLSESGDTLRYHDSLFINICPKDSVWIESYCSDEIDSVVDIYLGSMDSIISVSIDAHESPIYEVTESSLGRKNKVPDSYRYTEKISVSGFTSSDTLDCNLKVDCINCFGDTFETVHPIALKPCILQNRLFYGIYSSPSAVLLKREECLTYQCSNVSENLAERIVFKTKCPNDTVYLKFKLESDSQKEFIELAFDQLQNFEVYYPSSYIQLNDSAFSFNEISNVTIAFVPQKSEIISGHFSSIDFAFQIEVAESIIQKEVRLCAGDELNLNNLVLNAADRLTWNVQEETVSPFSDTRYQVSGISQSGCSVDEPVQVLVDYPLWYDCIDTLLCEGSRIALSDLIHTNARSFAFFDEETNLLIEDSLLVQKSMLYQVNLQTACNAKQITVCVNMVDCSTTEPESEMIFSPYFSPNGDGLSDVWKVEIPESVGTFLFSIYDRFGKCLAVFDKSPVIWNGTYRGKLLSSTDYWYSFHIYSDSKIHVGHFLLKNK